MLRPADYEDKYIYRCNWRTVETEKQLHTQQNHPYQIFNKLTSQCFLSIYMKLKP